MSETDVDEKWEWIDNPFSLEDSEEFRSRWGLLVKLN
jgi:hypothetical protein